jgi:hypothetical protein
MRDSILPNDFSPPFPFVVDLFLLLVFLSISQYPPDRARQNDEDEAVYEEMETIMSFLLRNETFVCGLLNVSVYRCVIYISPWSCVRLELIALSEGE